MFPKIEERSLSHPDNKALPLAALRAIVEKTRDLPEDYPVFVACDEEGNHFGKLWQVDVTKDGMILWPADEHHTPFDS